MGARDLVHMLRVGRFKKRWYGNANDTVDGRNPAPLDRPIIPLFCWVLYIPGGERFLPSIV